MIQRTRLPWKRRGHHHAQIHFPPLTGEEALLVANLLDRVIHSLWRAHGDAMADLLGCCDPDDALPKEQEQEHAPPREPGHEDDLF